MRPYRVLFVCVGNSCRSQMAEGFARAYGSDVMAAASAGLHPCHEVSPLTRRLMLEKNIDLGAAVPKSLGQAGADGCDLIVNLSGWRLPAGLSAEVREWRVADPYFFSEEQHREIRDQIERLVEELVLELRRDRERAEKPLESG